MAQLGFQKSSHSDQLEVLVTANVSVVSVAAWNEAKTPLAGPAATSEPKQLLRGLRLGAPVPELAAYTVT